MRIESRYNGPPDSAHGGVACGVLAGAVDPRRATVRLAAPPPLDEELEAVPGPDGAVGVVGPAGKVGSVRGWDVPADLEPLPRLSDGQLAEGRQEWLTNWAPDHPFPTCFGCGHERPDGDGLELYAGAIEGTMLRGAAWTPTAEGPGGEVPDWMVWAAVDCPSGGATFPWIDRTQGVLLGELSLHIRERPVAGVAHQIVARPLHRDGRKLTSDVALVAGDGTNIARGRSVWIAVSRPTRTG